MKKQISDNQRRRRIPWNLIVQIVLVLTVFYFLSRLITSLSFVERNGADLRATAPVSSLEIYDNFGFEKFDVKWNESTWAEVGTGSQIKQLDGVLILSREERGSGGLVAHRRKWRLSDINYVESRLLLSSDIQTQAGDVGVEINTTVDGKRWFVRCGIHGGEAEKTASLLCDTADGFSTSPVKVSYDTWHTVRFEVGAESAALTFFIDEQNIGKHISQEMSDLKLAEYSFLLEGSSSDDGILTGSFDYVQVKNR